MAEQHRETKEDVENLLLQQVRENRRPIELPPGWSYEMQSVAILRYTAPDGSSQFYRLNFERLRDAMLAGYLAATQGTKS